MAKRYSPKLKFQVVMEVLSEGKSPAEIGRAYDIHPNTIRNWIKKFKDNSSEVFSQNGELENTRHSTLDHRAPLTYLKERGINVK